MSRTASNSRDTTRAERGETYGRYNKVLQAGVSVSPGLFYGSCIAVVSMAIAMSDAPQAPVAQAVDAVGGGASVSGGSLRPSSKRRLTAKTSDRIQEENGDA